MASLAARITIRCWLTFAPSLVARRDFTMMDNPLNSTKLVQSSKKTMRKRTIKVHPDVGDFERRWSSRPFHEALPGRAFALNKIPSSFLDHAHEAGTGFDKLQRAGPDLDEVELPLVGKLPHLEMFVFLLSGGVLLGVCLSCCTYLCCRSKQTGPEALQESEPMPLVPDVSDETGKSHTDLILNNTSITRPTEPTLLDNTLLYLPAEAVRTLNLEPNMNDKGMGCSKTLWFGRVWELRQLLASDHKQKIVKVNAIDDLSTSQKGLIDEALNDPVTQKRMLRVAARWKGATLRSRCSLNVLDKLKFCNLRGTLIYAHGSGGCSWDNMRICRMIAGMGLLVVAPDGFSYPANSAMGKMRHKDVLPLTTADKDVDYWKPDLIYASGATGTHTYSTNADAVLDDPVSYRELYEKCYQLRRSELHFTIGRLPVWTRRKGFFLGGTSEGAMTVARFDDQRYGDMVCGRFINSFSVEYCYFTPVPEAGQIGGQLDVPTLNIIGTKDEYFGPENSVAKIVAEDDETGYGNENLTGNAFETFVDQKLEEALVCVLEDGVHGPCETHDNFLRRLFSSFFARPERIAELDRLWAVDPSFKNLIKLQDSTVRRCHVSKIFVPKMLFPQKMTLSQIEMAEHVSKTQRNEVNTKIAEEMAVEEKQRKDGQVEMEATLAKFRDKVKNKELKKQAAKVDNYYSKDKVTVRKNTKGDTSYRN